QQYYYTPSTGTLTDISKTMPFTFSIHDASLSYNPVLQGMVLSTANALQFDYISATTYWNGTVWSPEKNALIGSNIVFDTLCQKTVAVGRGRMLKYDASGWQSSTGDMPASQSAILSLAHDPASGSDIIMGAQSVFTNSNNGQYYLWVRACDGGQLPIYPSGPTEFSRIQVTVEAPTQRALLAMGDTLPDVWRWQTLPQPATPEMVTEIFFGQITPKSFIASDANGDGIMDAADLIEVE
ncbi:MAG: hypothetical protein ABI579_01625, partial [Candidatus Sumerlaeota bacterium]